MKTLPLAPGKERRAFIALSFAVKILFFVEYAELIRRIFIRSLEFPFFVFFFLFFQVNIFVAKREEKKNSNKFNLKRAKYFSFSFDSFDFHLHKERRKTMSDVQTQCGKKSERKAKTIALRGSVLYPLRW